MTRIATCSRAVAALALIVVCTSSGVAACADVFEGQFFRGEGDVEYLQLLDVARRMFGPDPEYQNLAMLYMPDWNGLIEGPTWNAWWIQNSYGPTYCALPFLEEPMLSFLQNAQDLWFNKMGDGKTPIDRVKEGKIQHWMPPDGCLCDAANLEWFVPVQGDGRVEIHDWCMEFTAAGLLMQAELLLTSRDAQAIEHYLPKLRRCADFIESRRDPENNLFLAGPAGNLLAPSYAGWKKPDGTYGKAYLTGLSITYIAALDRLVEVEKLAGRPDNAKQLAERRGRARQGLARLTTDEGYFIKSLDPDGARHGVYGAAKYGYFEAVCNHDAICFRVADDAQAEKIYAKIASIPGLRPHHVIIANYPTLDDTYEDELSGLWQFGEWVNGGHWSTCEARMIMGYYRLGRYDDARRSMQHLLGFARQFRMDNPLTDFGAKVYQPKQPINLCYDTFGPPAAMIRGLFEYLYAADSLTILPHIPPGITALSQDFPIRFGQKRLYLATVGTGAITRVIVNGKPWPHFDARSVRLPYDQTPEEAVIQIVLGDTQASPPAPRPLDVARTRLVRPDQQEPPTGLKELVTRVERVRQFHDRLVDADLGGRYEAAHARLAVECLGAAARRAELLAAGRLDRLPPPSQSAADKSYVDTVAKVCKGLENRLLSYKDTPDPVKRRIYQLWTSPPSATAPSRD